jgi:hypothetical protein
MEGANFIITGSFSDRGNAYELQVIVLEVTSRVIRFSSTKKIIKE